jgi:hypothetical protein
MEHVNQKNNLITNQPAASTFQPLFDENAARGARQVVPLPQ